MQTLELSSSKAFGGASIEVIKKYIQGQGGENENS